MPTVAELLDRATRRLDAVTETPRLDAELLLAHALNLNRAILLSRLKDDVDPELPEPLLSRREAGEPLAYIFGAWEFFSLDFDIHAPVLVPRPETEHLVEAVLEYIGDRPAHILDLCTGSGCVAVSIAHHAGNATVIATDQSATCLELARNNALKHEVEHRIAFREGDLFAALAPADGSFDVVCANPPYVADADWDSLSPTIRNFEDAGALLAGHDGLDVIRRILHDAPRYLRPGGLLALEIGYNQSQTIRELLEPHYETVRFIPDLAGIPRIACATRPE